MTDIQPPTVKLVAIAKDEAAYLPEWVFHHKRMGFDKIEIYYNRTTDNSIEMLEYLQSQFSGLSAFSIDWIDTCPVNAQFNLQYIAYAKAFEETRQKQDADYVMFLDIDEYWTPKNMSTSVQQVISKYPNADAISFQWINEYGRDESFAALNQDVIGKINPLVKTLINIKAKVVKHGYHMPELASGSKHIMMDGDPVRYDDKLKEGIAKDMSHMRAVMVLHRLFRSPKEYVSLLHRGRPSDEVQLKFNRGGYNYAMGREVKYPLSEAQFENYRKALDGFLAKPELSVILNKARDFVANRYQKTMDTLKTIAPKNFHDIARIFRGCSEAEMKQVHDAFAYSEFIRNNTDVEEIIEIAKTVDTSNRELGQIFWQRAKELRPQGPLILRKIAKYEADKLDGVVFVSPPSQEQNS
jgi:hypothetical protein